MEESKPAESDHAPPLLRALGQPLSTSSLWSSRLRDLPSLHTLPLAYSVQTQQVLLAALEMHRAHTHLRAFALHLLGLSLRPMLPPDSCISGILTSFMSLLNFAVRPFLLPWPLWLKLQPSLLIPLIIHVYFLLSLFPFPPERKLQEDRDTELWDSWGRQQSWKIVLRTNVHILFLL